ANSRPSSTSSDCMRSTLGARLAMWLWYWLPRWRMTSAYSTPRCIASMAYSQAAVQGLEGRAGWALREADTATEDSGGCPPRMRAGTRAVGRGDIAHYNALNAALQHSTGICSAR